MENTDKEIEDFINEISPKTGGIDELARLKIKLFIHKKMMDAEIEALSRFTDKIFNQSEVE
jgi:hypothetical protein